MKIEINLNNVITSKDQVKPGMKLWSVGQGGVTGVCPPNFVGQVIGFGSADYTFSPNSENATGFIIGDPFSPEVEFVVLASYLDGKDVNYNIPEEGYARNTDYPLEQLLEGTRHYNVYVTTRSFLPQPYNNWYMCDSKEKAQAVYEEMKSKWDNSHEEDRLEYQSRMDSMFDDFY